MASGSKSIRAISLRYESGKKREGAFDHEGQTRVLEKITCMQADVSSKGSPFQQMCGFGESTKRIRLLLTPQEASDCLGTSAKTLERLRSSGLGPKFVKIGRRVAYSLAALEEFIAHHTHGSTSEYPSK
jgi:predicted DNA-binding transcriptional regulator AlpA